MSKHSRHLLIGAWQSNPDLVWVGSREGNNRRSTCWGDRGVYKTTDGGATWEQVPAPIM